MGNQGVFVYPNDYDGTFSTFGGGGEGSAATRIALRSYVYVPRLHTGTNASNFLIISNSNFELVFVSRIPQIRLKKSVTEIL